MRTDSNTLREVCDRVETRPIDEAKRRISEQGCSVAAVTAGGEVFWANGSSVRPLFGMYLGHKDALKGASVADRVVGRAAACLLRDAGVAEVYGFLMSEGGLELLEAGGIKADCAELVPFIENASGSDICPMERAVEGIEDIAECVERLASFIGTMPDMPEL
jgi:hypothetical protein